MTRFLFSLSIAAIGLASMGSAACTTHTIVRPEPTVKFEKTCAKTACDAVQEATPALTPECKACISDWVDGCSYAVFCEDSEVVCAHACRGPACADPTACAEYKWVAHVEHFTATPGVEAACQNATADFATRCGQSRTDEDIARSNAECARDALVSTDTATAYYTCLGSAACDGPLQSHCDQTSSFGDELCATRVATCGSDCSDGERIGLNEIGSRLKPAMIAAARTCAQEATCEDATACLRAWWTILE